MGWERPFSGTFEVDGKIYTTRDYVPQSMAAGADWTEVVINAEAYRCPGGDCRKVVRRIVGEPPDTPSDEATDLGTGPRNYEQTWGR